MDTKLDQENEKLQKAQQRLGTLTGDLETAETVKTTTFAQWKVLEKAYVEAQSNQNIKQLELRAYVTATMQEARKILEIHRRVIHALKETQASLAHQKGFESQNQIQ